MNVLIIEDEERAANRLEQLLIGCEQNINVIAKIESIENAVNYLSKNNNIELIFSDIQLEDGLSFEIFEQAQVKCPIIFTTAFDQYAIQAFQTNGVDYLLKPVDEKRLQQSLDKVKNLSSNVSIDNILALANSAISQPRKFKTRFMIKVGERIKSIGVDEVSLFFSQDNATFILTTDKRKYVVDFSLDHIEELIDPELFYRVSRKYIVSINACNDIIAWSNSRLKIQVDQFEDDMIVVARDRVGDFKKWLDR